MKRAAILCECVTGTTPYHRTAQGYSGDFRMRSRGARESERSFHAFDVQSKSARNHQRIATTEVGQISAWSKHSKPMTFERKLRLSPLRFSHLLNGINAKMLRWMDMLSTVSIPPKHHDGLYLLKQCAPYLFAYHGIV